MTIPVTLDVAKLMHTCMKTAFLTGQLKIHSDQQLLEGRDLWMVSMINFITLFCIE
jgi:hypothetical protein